MISGSEFLNPNIIESTIGDHGRGVTVQLPTGTLSPSVTGSDILPDKSDGIHDETNKKNTSIADAAPLLNLTEDKKEDPTGLQIRPASVSISTPAPEEIVPKLPTSQLPLVNDVSNEMLQPSVETPILSDPNYVNQSSQPKPYAHQVGGHGPLCRIEGEEKILKPLQEKELSFYQSIWSENAPQEIMWLREFTPTFYGVYKRETSQLVDHADPSKPVTAEVTTESYTNAGADANAAEVIVRATMNVHERSNMDADMDNAAISTDKSSRLNSLDSENNQALAVEHKNSTDEVVAKGVDIDDEEPAEAMSLPPNRFPPRKPHATSSRILTSTKVSVKLPSETEILELSRHHQISISDARRSSIAGTEIDSSMITDPNHDTSAEARSHGNHLRAASQDSYLLPSSGVSAEKGRGLAKQARNDNAWATKMTDLMVSNGNHKDKNANSLGRSEYLRLQDLNARFAIPCVCDVKMGTRHYDDDAPPEKVLRHIEKSRNTTSGSVGIRFTGMQVYSRREQKYYFRDKYHGRTLKDDDLPGEFRFFFSDGFRLRVKVVRMILDKLEQLLPYIEQQKLFKFYSSSLLLVYEGNEDGENNEGDQNVNVDVRMIDFAHTQPSGGAEGDEGYAFGLCNLISILRKLLETETLGMQAEVDV